jgi:radical SAM superfamily enzyme YgiQ (UPF0313 family)
MSTETLRGAARARIAREIGVIRKAGARRIALVYPSPYRAGMSSLGYQVVYGALNDLPDTVCERSFLPDDPDEHVRTKTPLFTYESETAVGDFPVAMFSIAYELEIAGLVSCLELAGIPALASERDDRHPIVLAGGPLTFSNPSPLSPFVDAIVHGEAEDVLAPLCEALGGSGDRRSAKEALARLAHVTVPGRSLAPASIAQADDAHLPARARITSPDAELSEMFLIEAERGCSRACTYCVMRRSTNGGMRLAAADAILGAIPEHARRVGLVGAAVSDHPDIARIVHAIADGGRQVSLSSLRPDRLDDDLVSGLAKGGARTLTTAADGASDRMRVALKRGGKTRHLAEAAALVRRHGLERLKLYVMLGVPGETDADVDELVSFVREISHVCPVALGVAPFVSKKNTPLDGLPFAGIDVVEDRLSRLRTGLGAAATVKATSARWAWVEWALAQGGHAEGLAVLEAVRAGGSFAAYRRALRSARAEAA